MALNFSMKLNNIDLVMREDDFVIYADGEPLKTTGGREVAHKDSRLLKHLMIRLVLSNEPANRVVSYLLFSYQKDSLERGKDILEDKLDNVLKSDHLVLQKIQKSGLMDIEKAIQLTKNNKHVFNLIFWSASTIAAGLEEFWDLCNISANDDKNSILKSVQQFYRQLPNEKKAAALFLGVAHDIGLLAPLMLIFRIISPSEYANAVLSLGTHNQEGKAEERFKKLVLPGADYQLHRIDWSAPEQSFDLFYTEALECMEYLSFFEETKKKITVIEEIIRRGEGDNVEFKSSLRWDVRQNKKNPAIEHAALKTICAFLNSNGGVLLLGVEDDGRITGIEKDGFDNDDRFLLHLWNLIKSSIGQEATPFIKTGLGKINGKTVCKVECRPSRRPVYLSQKGFDEAFYIRTGPGSSSLSISETMNYIAEHFDRNDDAWHKD